MKRTPLQRHNRAMNLCNKTYRQWQLSEAGASVTRCKHRQYNRLLTYLNKLEDAYLAPL